MELTVPRRNKPTLVVAILFTVPDLSIHEGPFEILFLGQIGTIGGVGTQRVFIAGGTRCRFNGGGPTLLGAGDT